MPEDPAQEEDAEALAAALTDRLAELARMRRRRRLARRPATTGPRGLRPRRGRDR
ncbi:hypothetical protein [Dankookia sp. P2]|uniref:hypothetical protein n=1 Tax=Dankookia sp. P2 TaxID=3423955 RepID=UPI003D675253